jgi:hypothetical protein
MAGRRRERAGWMLQGGLVAAMLIGAASVLTAAGFGVPPHWLRWAVFGLSLWSAGIVTLTCARVLRDGPP